MVYDMRAHSWAVEPHMMPPCSNAATGPVARYEEDWEAHTFLDGRRLDRLEAASLRVVGDGKQEQRANNKADRAGRPQSPPVVMREAPETESLCHEHSSHPKR